MDKQKSNKNNSIDVEVLLKNLDSRTTPNRQKAADSKAAVRSHWQQAVKQHKQTQRTYIWAAAASLMLMSSIIFLNINQRPDSLDGGFLASVEGFSGQVQWQQADGAWQDMQLDDPIKAGSVIKTAGQSYLTLKLTDQSEIRLAANSEIMTQAGVIELRIGQLYHDTDE